MLAYIGIGSNIGDREFYIVNAVKALGEGLLDIVCSRFYRTEPRDYFDQDYFVNIVLKGETELSPLQLLDFTQSIEKAGGRMRDKKIPKGPRTLDLDILVYGNERIDEEHLKIPHLSIQDRRFVLIPLLEIEPEICDPRRGIPYYKYLEIMENQGVYLNSLSDYNRLF